jgi:predicted small lipoprotein YifL
MKKIFLSALSIATIMAITSCGSKTPENKMTTEFAKGDTWAEEVESKTTLIKPEDFDDAYWASISKGVDRKKIFSTITNAILSGDQQAYSLMTDSAMTVDEVKASLINSENNAAITSEDLSMVRCREKWAFDKENFILQKQVTRIDLTIKKISPEGVYVGDKPLFYVKLNN